MVEVGTVSRSFLWPRTADGLLATPQSKQLGTSQYRSCTLSGPSALLCHLLARLGAVLCCPYLRPEGLKGECQNLSA